MATLTLTFTAPTPSPANGYLVKYWEQGLPATVQTVVPNPTSSPITITVDPSKSYQGTIQAICGPGSSSPEVSFNVTALTYTFYSGKNCSNDEPIKFRSYNASLDNTKVYKIDSVEHGEVCVYEIGPGSLNANDILEVFNDCELCGITLP